MATPSLRAQCDDDSEHGEHRKRCRDGRDELPPCVASTRTAHKNGYAHRPRNRRHPTQVPSPEPGPPSSSSSSLLRADLPSASRSSPQGHRLRTRSAQCLRHVRHVGHSPGDHESQRRRLEEAPRSQSRRLSLVSAPCLRSLTPPGVGHAMQEEAERQRLEGDPLLKGFVDPPPERPS